MKILVTGATGNVGKFVVKELLHMGEDVVAAGTNKSKLQAMFGNTIDKVILDLTDNQTFSKALENIDRVFLMRPPHLGKPDDLYPFIQAMKDKDIRLVSFLSLMGVEKNPFPPHHKIEKQIEEAGIPYAHVRPGFFMQNISGIHSVEIRDRDEIFIPAGKSKTSFIDTADIGLAAATLLHNPIKFKHTAHTITGKEALNYSQIAAILSEVTGRTITYVSPSLFHYRHYYIKRRGLPKDYVNVTVALYLMNRLGTAKAVTNDFYHLTKKYPRTFKEFAIENINCFR
ncbi:SDR family oxidoreductase [Virgibacillus salexigens]|uniref:SDR family oxidoreductase n=1 Tax=Virgibacillus salexigens TaxID=61016 RepID=UPI00190B04D5|nr:SDR family oxidoreductase [Virgibacillus salexigens]